MQQGLVARDRVTQSRSPPAAAGVHDSPGRKTGGSSRLP